MVQVPPMTGRSHRALAAALLIALLCALAGCSAANMPGTLARGGTTPTPRAAAAPTQRVAPQPQASDLPAVMPADLPAEARQTLELIERDGPFPYEQDGGVFQNRERLLPRKPSGYYREYTVETPGSDDRGARRIVAGRNGERYYTDDHYSSFVEVVSP
jgi:ribonuclease T1